MTDISTISFIVALVVITVMIVIFFKQKAKPAKRSFRPEAMEEPGKNTAGFNPELVKAKWAEIGGMSAAGPSGLKNSLIEADKLLDYCMIGKGFQGETMGDRLKSGGSAFSNLNAIWDAHKLRNEMVHEVEIDVVGEQIKHAISNLGQGIRDLGVSI